MEPTNRQLLLSLRRTLLERVLPGAADVQTSRLLHISAIAIDELLHRDTLGDAGTQAREARRVALQKQGENLIQAAGLLQGGPFCAHTRSTTPAPDVPDERRARLADLAATIYSAVSHESHSPHWNEEASAFLLELVREEAECTFRTPHAWPHAAPDAPSTIEKIRSRSAYFRAKSGGGPAFAIESVNQLSGGFSNETFAVTTNDRGTRRVLVVRKAKPVGIMEPYVAALEEEYPFLQLLHAGGLAVPQPLWLETNKGVLGQAFTVTSFVSGANAGTSLQANQPIGEGLWRDFARTLAQLHALPWESRAAELPQKLTLSPGASVSQSIARMLDRLKHYWEISTLAASPTLEILFQWLGTNEPASGQRVVITHGDLGFHNMLCEGDRITAVLDWETVMLCSPVKDLQVVRDIVVPPGVWPQFLAWYVEAGGQRPDASEFQYYRILRLFQSIMCTAIALEKMFIWADPLNIEFLELGIPARAYFYEQTQRELTLLLT